MRRKPYTDSMGVRRGSDHMPDPPYPKPDDEQRKLVEWIVRSCGLPTAWVRFRRDGYEDVKTIPGPMTYGDPPQSVYGAGRHWQGALIDLVERCKELGEIAYFDGFENRYRRFRWNQAAGKFEELEDE